MDIYCPVCGEPWDHDELHDTGLSYKSACVAFKRDGCRVFGAKHGDGVAFESQLAKYRAVYETADGDMDSAAADLEDLG